MILALILPLLFAQETEVQVTFPHESKAYGTEIELGEIATLSGGTPELLLRVKALELGYVPAPGFSRVVRTDRVLNLFASKFPGVKVSFIGQGATRVYPVVAKVTGAEMVAAARAQLLQSFDDTRFSFQPRGNVADITIPQGSGVHKIQARLETQPSRSGFLTVPVDVLVDGTRFRTVWTAWDVVLWETHKVLSRDLKQGEVIGEKDLKEERIQVGMNSAGGVKSELLPGAVAGHDMLKGTMVKPMDVIRPRVVQPQDLIRLKIKRGGITASVMATVLSAGAIGDRIRVRTVDKNINFNATIQTRDTCVLMLGK